MHGATMKIYYFIFKSSYALVIGRYKWLMGLKGKSSKTFDVILST